jgi:hypothetical protein
MEKAMLLGQAITLLEEIERTPEKKLWCKRYSVYSKSPGQDSFQHDVHSFIDRAYEEGLIIANYDDVIQHWKLDERHIAAADPEWLEAQPYLCVLASIAWHFRREHFCEGSLIGESIANGVLLRLFRRLKVLCPAPAPATTLKNLYSCRCGNVPETPGVYWVLVPEGLVVRFTDHTYNPTVPCYPPEALLEKYMSCSDRETLYIGKADGRKGLRQRLKQYMKCGWGKATNHKGGRAVWQIEDAGLLLLAYEECEDASAREKQLLAEYKETNGTYPLANWRG